MKIVFVSDAIYPYNKGGKEKRLYEISTRLAALDHEVHVYTMHWWETPEKVRIEHGVQVHALSKYYPMYRGERRSSREALLFALACFKLCTVDFDVLDVDHMPFFPILTTWIVCKLRGKKLHGTWHEALSTQDWIEYMGKSGYVAAAIERVCTKLPNRITAASAQTQRLLALYHNREKGVSLVASGIDSQTIQKVRPVKADCDVLYVGRLVKDKHVDKLVRAMAVVAKQQPDIRCVIIGHGIEMPRLKRLVSRLKLRNQVLLMDPLPKAEDVYAYMKRAKVFVLPSVREGFGIVALEALACGTPVVTVNSPANAAKDLITDGEMGSIVQLDAAAIAEAIIFWTSKASRRAKITMQAAGSDWRVLVAQQQEVYAS